MSAIDVYLEHVLARAPHSRPILDTAVVPSVDLNKAYRREAERLGVAVSALTDAQKKQAMLDAVMGEGE